MWPLPSNTESHILLTAFNAGCPLPYCGHPALEHFPAAQLHFSLLCSILLLLDCLSVNQNITAALTNSSFHLSSHCLLSAAFCFPGNEYAEGSGDLSSAPRLSTDSQNCILSSLSYTFESLLLHGMPANKGERQHRSRMREIKV